MGSLDETPACYPPYLSLTTPSLPQSATLLPVTQFAKHVRTCLGPREPFREAGMLPCFPDCSTSVLVPAPLPSPAYSYQTCCSTVCCCPPFFCPCRHACTTPYIWGINGTVPPFVPPNGPYRCGSTLPLPVYKYVNDTKLSQRDPDPTLRLIRVFHPAGLKEAIDPLHLLEPQHLHLAMRNKRILSNGT